MVKVALCAELATLASAATTIQIPKRPAMIPPRGPVQRPASVARTLSDAVVDTMRNAAASTGFSDHPGRRRRPYNRPTFKQPGAGAVAVPLASRARVRRVCYEACAHDGVP